METSLGSSEASPTRGTHMSLPGAGHSSTAPHRAQGPILTRDPEGQAHGDSSRQERGSPGLESGHTTTRAAACPGCLAHLPGRCLPNPQHSCPNRTMGRKACLFIFLLYRFN